MPTHPNTQFPIPHSPQHTQDVEGFAMSCDTARQLRDRNESSMSIYALKQRRLTYATQALQIVQSILQNVLNIHIALMQKLVESSIIRAGIYEL